ncbi:TlpA disulfide reductase family protein [Marinifilum fragile]|uniref:TlpA family protein disulfide reductase n=1 Tax=Marinifilum fragile TaxID=570161 RepID=UPI002AA6FF66|nr:TlpA disulfide reductase family protein [Marinifilum fragile]
MHKIRIAIFCLALSFVSCKEDAKTVRLHGELKNFASELSMGIETPQAYILRENIQINLDDQNKFDITFNLDAPAYFRLGRNTLYLSPGDDLDLFCDLNDPMAATFTGKGAEACLYLRSKPFPKGGSYLSGGQLLKGDPSLEEVKIKIEEKVKSALASLNGLDGVSDRFKKLERGRIMFDAANSYLSYPGYAAYFKKLSKEELPAFTQKAEKYFKADVEKYIQSGGDADYLNLDTYRGICGECVEHLGEENVDRAILDFIKTNELIYHLSNKGPVAEVLSKRVEIESKIEQVEYKEVISKAFKNYDALQPGKAAPRLSIRSKEGKEILLSDFKGKLVVIDVWATWCGPCKAESPYFEQLAKKYGNETVKFLSISIDSDKNLWDKYLSKHTKTSEQFICNRTEFKEYELQSVPRFMLIDKQGNFIDAFATRPSDPTFEVLLQKYI